MSESIFQIYKSVIVFEIIFPRVIGRVNVDDIYLSCYVLDMVADKYGYDFLQENASFEVEPIVKECESKSLEILNDEEIKSIISYIGL